MSSGKMYPGLYRASVVANKDPLQKGRLQVQIPSVLGCGAAVWALPHLAPSTAGAPVPPPGLGASVWVQFQGGQSEYPVWSGLASTPAPLPLIRRP